MASFGFCTNVWSFAFSLMSSFLLREFGLTLALVFYPLVVIGTLVFFFFFCNNFVFPNISFFLFFSITVLDPFPTHLIVSFRFSCCLKGVKLRPQQSRKRSFICKTHR